jgi:hypothetical protein
LFNSPVASGLPLRRFELPSGRYPTKAGSSGPAKADYQTAESAVRTETVVGADDIALMRCRAGSNGPSGRLVLSRPCGIHLAEVLDDKPGRIPLPAGVWQGIDAVRLSGLTNMLDRPVVARLAGELGYPDAVRWIEEHPKEYAEGVFRGFIVDPQGGKP